MDRYILVANDLLHKVRIGVNRILSLVNSSFQLWTHLQHVHEIHTKDEQIQDWEVWTSNKQQVIQELLVVAHR